MNNNADVIIFALQIGALWVFLAFAVKDYALDRLRQNLFSIRGRLFDEVAAGTGSFEDRSYVHLRSYINGVIRRGHMVSISRSLISNIVMRVPFLRGNVSRAELRADVESSIRELDELKQKDARVARVQREVWNELAKYYLLTSPLFICLIICLVPLVIIKMGWMRLRKAMDLAFERFLAKDMERGISLEADSDATPSMC